MAGVAGYLYVHTTSSLLLETFGVAELILLLVMVAIGGSGRYWGLYGALILTAVPPLLLDYGTLNSLLFGLALLVRPDVPAIGIAGAAQAFWGRSCIRECRYDGYLAYRSVLNLLLRAFARRRRSDVRRGKPADQGVIGPNGAGKRCST